MFVLIRKVRRFSVGIKFYSAYAPQNVLNDKHASETIKRLKSAQSIKSQSNESVRRAAVLIPLCVVDGRVSLLYTRRTSRVSTHKGQVSFPGGMEDPEDPNLEHTALRETEEELGIDPSGVKVWGSGNFIFARGNCILPVVGEILGSFDRNKLEVNPHEVEEAFTVPLEDLCDPRKNGYTQFKTGYSLPVFLGGHRRIWGVTALITNTFLKALLPSEAYYHRIKFLSTVTSSNSTN